MALDTPRPTRRSLLGALPLVPWLASCSGERVQSSGRGVLVLVLDALRYGRTSFAEGGPDTTPRLREWAGERAIVLDDMWSASPTLVPAHVALLTGCDPMVARTPRVELSDGRVIDPITPWTIPSGAPSLASEFLKDGWSTAAFIDHRFPILRGLERGFLRFDSFGGQTGEGAGSGLANVCFRFWEWLTDMDEDTDWFAYVHLNDLELVWNEEEWKRTGHPELETPDLDPALDWVPPVGARSPVFHALPPRRVLSGQPPLSVYQARYDAALNWVDTNFVRLFEMLRASGRLEDTTVVLVGSHGISFGESGLFVTSGVSCDVDLHVPCIIHPAARLGVDVGRRIDSLTSTLDIAPTLLDLVGLDVPRGMHGLGLTGLLAGDGTAVREAAFGSHGDVEGLCAVSEQDIYVEVEPGKRRISLDSSWFGDDRRRHNDVFRYLYSRQAGQVHGLSGAGLLNEERAAHALRAAAEAWYADMGAVREVLHPSAWNAEKRGEDVIAELRSKGLIGG